MWRRRRWWRRWRWGLLDDEEGIFKNGEWSLGLGLEIWISLRDGGYGETGAVVGIGKLSRSYGLWLSYSSSNGPLSPVDIQMREFHVL